MLGEVVCQFRKGVHCFDSVQQQCFYPLCYKWQSNLLIVTLPWQRTVTSQLFGLWESVCVFPVSCGLFLWLFRSFPPEHVRLIPSLYSWALTPDLDQVPRYYTLAAWFSQGRVKYWDHISLHSTCHICDPWRIWGLYFIISVAIFAISSSPTPFLLYQASYVAQRMFKHLWFVVLVKQSAPYTVVVVFVGVLYITINISYTDLNPTSCFS